MDNVSKRARQMVREREKGRGKRQASTADNHGTARRVRHIDTHTQARACTGICNAVHTAQHGTHHTPDSTVHTTQHARHMHTHTHTQHTHTHTHYTALRTPHAHACALHRTMHATCTRPRPRTPHAHHTHTHTTQHSTAQHSTRTQHVPKMSKIKPKGTKRKRTLSGKSASTKMDVASPTSSE